jgi:hypothetical protein
MKRQWQFETETFLKGLARSGACWGVFALTAAALTVKAATIPVDVSTLPVLYTDPYTGNQVLLGGFSGLYPVPGDPERLFVLTDRGPNPDYGSAKLFVRPDFGPQILIVHLNSDGTAAVESILPLKKPDGSPVSGWTNPKPPAESLLDLWLNPMGLDNDGLDTEGLTIDKWGNFWVCEEYKPSVAMVGPDGTVQMRLVPIGTASGTEAIPTIECLPAVYAKRCVSSAAPSSWPRTMTSTWVWPQTPRAVSNPFKLTFKSQPICQSSSPRPCRRRSYSTRKRSEIGLRPRAERIDSRLPCTEESFCGLPPSTVPRPSPILLRPGQPTARGRPFTPGGSSRSRWKK